MIYKHLLLIHKILSILKHGVVILSQILQIGIGQKVFECVICHWNTKDDWGGRVTVPSTWSIWGK